MKGPKPAGLTKPTYPMGSMVANKGSPSLKENASSVSNNHNYLTSLKNSIRNKGMKLGSPTTEGPGRHKGSPDLNRPENALKIVQNKYLPGKLVSSDPPEGERSLTPTIMQKLASQRRVTGKKLSFSPSPSGNSPNEREESVNKSFTDNQGSPKPGSPPKNQFISVGTAQRGSPKLGSHGTGGGSISYTQNSPGSSSLVYPGSPSTQTAEYLLNASKFPLKLFEYEGMKITQRCINHEEKRSKYHVVEDYKVRRISEPLSFKRGVCSKCAVRLANLGFKTEEIVDEEEEQRKAVLKAFLDRIEQSISFHGRAFEVLEAKKSSLRQFYEREFEALEDFEESIDKFISILQQNKTDIRHLLEAESQKEAQRFAEIQDVMERNLESINALHQDVSKGFDSAVMEMKLVNVQKILRGYDQKLQMFNKKTKERLLARATVVAIERLDNDSVVEITKKMSGWFKIRQETLDEDEDDLDPETLLALADPEEAEEEDEAEDGRQGAVSDENKSPAPHMYVSFDNKEVFESALVPDMPHTHSAHNLHPESDKSAQNHGPSSSHKYISILDKISESQNQKNSYYSSLVKEKEAEAESLFVITPNGEDLSMKQTPELGQKGEVPDYLREQFERMHSQFQAAGANMSKAIKPTHVESLSQDLATSSLQQKSRDGMHRSEMEELFSNIGKENPEFLPYAPAKCQKILFKDKK